VTASVKHSWEAALDYLASAASGLPQPGERLRTLLRGQHALYQAASVEQLFGQCLADAAGQLAADYGAVILMDRQSGQPALAASHSAHPRPSAESPFSRTLIQRCYNTGESLLWREEAGPSSRLGQGGPAPAAAKSLLCALLRTPQRSLGVLYLERSAGPGPLQPADLRLADALAANMAAAVENWQRIQDKQRSVFVQTVLALAQAVELRDPYTAGHAQRVTDYALMLAQELNLTEGECQDLRLGAPLHDIGKIGIDDAILRKTTPLTRAEFEQMQSHTVKGVAILQPIPEMAPILPLVRSHHERWDGTGYPDGLAEENVPFLARVLAVADTFDAMTTDRSYRAGLSLEMALAEIARQAGTQFDADCTLAFVRLAPRLEERFADRDLPDTATGVDLCRQLALMPELALASSPSRVLPAVKAQAPGGGRPVRPA
jgi:HD-GYP domain-containing protein (c-di-GMP phosphodiesterase class II)